MIILSHILTELTPIYGGARTIGFRTDKSIRQGKACNTMKWFLPNHCGTHIDAPRHFFDEKSSITDYSIEQWIFKEVNLVDVLDIKPGQLIRPEELGVVENCELLLLRTGFEKHRCEEVYWENSPGLAPDLAEYLLAKCPSIRAIGIDFISVSNLNSRETGREAHRRFLGANILLIEDMKLAHVENIPKKILVAPLFVSEADAAPCTIFGLDD